MDAVILRRSRPVTGSVIFVLTYFLVLVFVNENHTGPVLRAVHKHRRQQITRMSFFYRYSKN